MLVYRISKQPKMVSRINLMLLEKDGKTHYCSIKKLLALLYDQAKKRNKKYYCEMCLTKHVVDCNGVNGRPTKVEKLDKDSSFLEFKNHKNKMKAPFIIHAD